MPNARAVRRKLSKKVIQNLGFDTILLRANSSQELDAYGEPTGVWQFDEFDIRIVIDDDKRDNDDSEIGGLPDKKRETICFYCEGDYDIRSGDKIVYPAGSDDQWLVDIIRPMVLNDVVVITEVKAYRDARY